MNTVLSIKQMYSQRCTQLNTLAIMNTAFNLYLNALSTGLYIPPLYAGFFNGLGRLQQKIIGLKNGKLKQSGSDGCSGP